MTPGLYRVVSGHDAGMLVRFDFINSSGNADCRIAEDFGPYKKGWVAVFAPEDLRPEPDQAEQPDGRETT